VFVFVSLAVLFGEVLEEVDAEVEEGVVDKEEERLGLH
jgi:hypothetical protein